MNICERISIDSSISVDSSLSDEEDSKTVADLPKFPKSASSAVSTN